MPWAEGRHRAEGGVCLVYPPALSLLLFVRLVRLSFIVSCLTAMAFRFIVGAVFGFSGRCWFTASWHCCGAGSWVWGLGRGVGWGQGATPVHQVAWSACSMRGGFGGKGRCQAESDPSYIRAAVTGPSLARTRHALRGHPYGTAAPASGTRVCVYLTATASPADRHPPHPPPLPGARGRHLRPHSLPPAPGHRGHALQPHHSAGALLHRRLNVPWAGGERGCHVRHRVRDGLLQALQVTGWSAWTFHLPCACAACTVHIPCQNRSPSLPGPFVSPCCKKPQVRPPRAGGPGHGAVTATHGR